MELTIVIHTNEAVEQSKEVIERLVETNLNSKVSAYLKKYDDKKDAEWNIELKIEKNKKDLFNGKLLADFDGDEFIFEREDYSNLDDLINNLFKHLKEELSSK